MERFRRRSNSSKQQQSQPNIFAVTVVIVALGCSLYFLSQSPPDLLAQLLLQIFLPTSHRAHDLHVLASFPASGLSDRLPLHRELCLHLIEIIRIASSKNKTIPVVQYVRHIIYTGQFGVRLQQLVLLKYIQK